MTGKRIATQVAVIAATAGIAVGLGSGGASATHPSTTRYNCPLGYVCVYPKGQNPITHNVKPLYKWAYGTHNLHGVYGKHYIVDNQTGVWGDLECSRANGKGMVVKYHHPKAHENVNLTPVNSIKIVRDIRPYLGLFGLPDRTC